MKSHEPMSEVKKSLSRRIKEAEESTDPTFLRSNKLYYELRKEKLEAHLDAQRRGIPSAEAPGHLCRLLRSMGFEPSNFSAVVEYTTATNYNEYKARIERLGFPEKCCEKTATELVLCDTGDLPKPDVIYADNHGCDADHRYTAESLGDWFNIPVFYLDVPLNEDDKPNLANLNYIADQLGEFIEWAEKTMPGVKYDKDRHIEILESDAIGAKYRREIYQLIKHVPCPITPQDGIGKAIIMFEPSRYPNIQKAVEYLQIYRDELGERVASGKGPYPEERLRLFWAGQAHGLRTLNPGKLLLARKVALPLALQGNTPRNIGLRCAPYGEMSEYGIKLSPLQEEARTCDTSYWGGPGKRWVNGTLDLARDIGAHGIIHFNLIGCTPMRSMGSAVVERADKELGIPVLNIEGRQMDRDYMSQEQFEEILSLFIDKCFDRAGKSRQ